MATQAEGPAERDAALLMLSQRQTTSLRRPTVGADKACDTKNFIAGARALNVTAQVQKNEQGRRSHLDQRTTRHAGYSVSLSRRWLIEKTFGWLKQTGPLAQVKLRGARPTASPSIAAAVWASNAGCVATSATICTPHPSS